MDARHDCTETRASLSFGSSFLEYLKKPRQSLRKRLGRSKKASKEPANPKPELSRSPEQDQVKTETETENETDIDDDSDEDDIIQVTTRRVLPNPAPTTKEDGGTRHAASKSSNTRPPDEQRQSPFLQKLPIEIRRMIYDHLWLRENDQHFHCPRGRHLYFESGRWANFRCVMSERDAEEPDNIQKIMDRTHEDPHNLYSPSDRDVQMRRWMSRLTGLWGARHYRCEEVATLSLNQDPDQHRFPPRVHHRGFLPLMTICKRTYPEILESILESHTWLLNDMGSAHRFLVTHPPPTPNFLRRHIRSLDLTLNLTSREYASFALPPPSSSSPPPPPTCCKKIVQGRAGAAAVVGQGRLRQLLSSLSQLSTLHDLRISLDVRGYGPWRKIPERGIVEEFFLYSPTSSLFSSSLKKFTLELPPKLDLPRDLLVGDVRGLDEEDERKLPFDLEVVRRPEFRYWQWDADSGGEVHGIRWLRSWRPTTMINGGGGRGKEGEEGKGEGEWNTSIVVEKTRRGRASVASATAGGGGTVTAITSTAMVGCRFKLDWGCGDDDDDGEDVTLKGKEGGGLVTRDSKIKANKVMLGGGGGGGRRPRVDGGTTMTTTFHSQRKEDGVMIRQAEVIVPRI